jgi:tetratricopeptide (TPR) repeat protein
VAQNPRIDDLRKRLERDPASRLFAQLAEELRKEGELDEAIRVSQEGLQKNPAYPSARMTLGRAFLDKGDLAAARVEFEAVLKGAPDNILASRYLGDCLEGLGNPQGALERFRSTLLMAPGDRHILARIAALEERLAGPPPTAEPVPVPLAAADETFELERPYESPPTRVVEGSTNEGVVGAADKGTPEPAAAFFEQTLPGRPSMLEPNEIPAVSPEVPPRPEAPPLSSATLGELYFNQGFTDKAMEVYRELLEREPSNERARARLVEIQALDRHLRDEETRGPEVPKDPRAARREAIERTIARLEALLGALRKG